MKRDSRGAVDPSTGRTARRRPTAPAIPQREDAKPMALYDRLFEPVQVGPITIRNRIVRSAHSTGLSDAALIAYHEARAWGGVGMSTIEATSVHPRRPAASRFGTMPACSQPHRRPRTVVFRRLRLYRRPLPAPHYAGRSGNRRVVHRAGALLSANVQPTSRGLAWNNFLGDMGFPGAESGHAVRCSGTPSGISLFDSSRRSTHRPRNQLRGVAACRSGASARATPPPDEQASTGCELD